MEWQTKEVQNVSSVLRAYHFAELFLYPTDYLETCKMFRKTAVVKCPFTWRRRNLALRYHPDSDVTAKMLSVKTPESPCKEENLYYFF